jgi:NADH-quinone oxidoreductase subunit M
MFIVSVEFYNLAPESGFLVLGEYLKITSSSSLFSDFKLTLQIDKLSSIMLILSSLLLILVSLSSWNVKKQSSYFSLLIFFSGAIFGVFSSTNLLWFFIFWELTLVPMLFLIGIWGAENRIYATIKFFIYTHFASMFILLAFYLIYKESGVWDFSLIKEVTLVSPVLIWWLLFIGFAVKIPLFPFHTWLPDAHVQAPAPISVLLAGVLLKLGAYGIIRFVIQLLPETSQEFAIYMLIFGFLTFMFSAIVAIYQTHLKKMVAYSSISHMGLVMIALSTLTFEGLSAGLYEMLGHAFIISPLFLIAGFLHHKTGSWEMQDLGGLMQKAPYISAIFIIAGLGALGMPGTMGFIGEITILLSSIETFGTPMILIALGSMFGAGYIIWTIRRVIYGEMSEKVKKTNFEISKLEFAVLSLFTGIIIIFGIYPQAIFSIVNSAFAGGF